MGYKWASHDQKIVQDLETFAFIPEGHPLWDEFQTWISEGNAPAPFETIEQAKEDALKIIDLQAESIRELYITPGSGQALAYQAKEEEAKLYLSDDPATRDEGGYPHLSAETGITAPSMEEVAQKIVALANQWRIVSARIEGERARMKSAIKNAATKEAVDTILQNAQWPRFQA